MKTTILVMWALAATGCRSTSVVNEPATSPVTARAPCDVVDLLSSPRAVFDYYAMPAASENVFQWQGWKARWIVKLAGDGGAFAGMVFRYPEDIREHVSHASLKLRLTPGSMASALRVGLVCRGSSSPPVLISCSLPASAPADPDAAQLSVALSNFGSMGVRLSPAGQPTAERAPFDWSCVREIRFLCAEDAPPVERNFMIERLCIFR